MFAAGMSFNAARSMLAVFVSCLGAPASPRFFAFAASVLSPMFLPSLRLSF
jgi:hypothetical protein